MTRKSLAALVAFVVLASPAISLAQSGGGGAGGGAGGGGAGGAAGSAAGSPSAGSAGAGTTGIGGVPQGPANAGGLNNSINDPSGAGNASKVPAPPPPTTGTQSPRSSLDNGRSQSSLNSDSTMTVGSSGPTGQSWDQGPRTSHDDAIDAEQATVDRRLKGSICRGC